MFMANHSRSSSHDIYSILGIGSVCKAYKSLVSKLYPVKKNLFPRKAKAKDKANPNEKYCKDKRSKRDEDDMKTVHDLRYDSDGSPRGVLKHHKYDNFFRHGPISSAPVSRNTSPSRLSRTASRKSQTPTPAAAASFLRSMTRRSSVGGAAALQRSLSRTTSRRSTTPIMFSNSNGLIKPPPIEMTLECTLEELCFGCSKKIKITRDAVTDDGQIIEGEEVLRIKVKPGWTNGTKITFEGMGNEIPGTDPSDIVFEIAEMKHPLYTKEGDDLELAVKIPLVKALTGGNISIPLLGGKKMSLTIDEIIYPGYQRTIAGEGMPKPKEKGQRGNMIIAFLVEFPKELTDEQRSQVVSILDDSCYSSP